MVKYVQDNEDNDFLYRFHSVVNIEVPLKRNYVRLINAAGEWRLTPINSTQTEIAYTWNGELRGGFPSWALTRAWKEQGLEIIIWLKEALE